MERKKAIKETLATVKQVDENIWTLVYKGSYGLDELLEKGVSGMLGLGLHKNISIQSRYF